MKKKNLSKTLLLAVLSLSVIKWLQPRKRRAPAIALNSGSAIGNYVYVGSDQR
jgi:hypothetical protein